MSKKVFLYPCDSFLGRNLGPVLEERGYEVLGAFNGSQPPAFASTAYKFLQIADVVVVEILGNEKAARDSAVHMANQPFGGREQTLIGISNPLTWASTRPVLQPAVQFPSLQGGAEDAEGGGAAGEAGAEPLAGSFPDVDGDAFPPPPDNIVGLDAEQNLLETAGSEVDVEGEMEDAPPLPVMAAVFQEKDAAVRVPCLAGRAAWEVEMLFMRSSRRGKLRTHVICPGFLYGQGEDDVFLFPLFRDAWAVARPLPIYGSGQNQLPVIHVRDLAAFTCGVALLPTLEQQYLLAADMDAGDTYIPREETLLVNGIDRFTLNLNFSSSILPDEAGYSPSFASGFINNIERVADEFQSVRYVTPLRLVLVGPPMAGKSALAARLAKLYGLRHINVKDLLAAAQALSNPSAPAPTGTTAGELPPIALDPEVAKAIATEMGGKEGRVSVKNMGALLKAVLSLSELRNRGYVLDSLPKDMAMSKYAFMQLQEMSEEEIADKEKGGGKAPAKAAIPAKAGKGGGPDTGPDIPENHKLVANELVPSHLIHVQCSDEELKVRLKVLEVAEFEHLKKSMPPVPEGKGAKATKPPPVGGHNNEKDFARRLDVWKKYSDEAEEDLQQRIKAVEVRWNRLQAEAEAERQRLEAESKTLRAKRRRAKELATAQATAAASAIASPPADEAPPSGPEAEVDASEAVGGAEAKNGKAGSCPEAEGGGGSGSGEGEQAAQGEEGEAPDGPKLPKYGGLVGVLVQDAGVQYIQVTSEKLEEGPSHMEDMKVLRLPALEQQLCAAIGAPHNFDGFPTEEEEEGGSSGDDETPEGGVFTRAGIKLSVAARMAAKLAAAAGRAARAAKEKAEEERMAAKLVELEAQEQVAAEFANKAHDMNFAHASAMLQQCLMTTMMPTITKALTVVAKDRSLDPLRTVAQFLMDEAERIAKIAAKGERDVARELAAQAKAERELAAKVAALEAGQLATDEASSRSFSPSKSTRRAKIPDNIA
eukprot:gene27156-2391_t